MRRLLFAAATLLAAVVSISSPAYAQSGRGGDMGGDPGQTQAEQDAADKRRSEEWGDRQAPLPALRNAGPCPFVKTLYDAARYVEFKEGREASADVGFTGEIQGVSASCAYKEDQPITVQMNVLFELGRGPQAGGSSKTYRYWIAVTDRGPGIGEEEQTRIFEPHFRRATHRETQGMGIGLYLARRICQNQGGSLTMQSKVGVGTRFVVTLPAGAPAA